MRKHITQCATYFVARLLWCIQGPRQVIQVKKYKLDSEIKVIEPINAQGQMYLRESREQSMIVRLTRELKTQFLSWIVTVMVASHKTKLSVCRGSTLYGAKRFRTTLF